MRFMSLVVVSILLSPVILSLPKDADYPYASWVPAHPNNYTTSNREENGIEINYVIIHTVEGSYQSAISWFKNPSAQCSAHYIISKKGEITQMVKEKDIAWHAGNWIYNKHSIGIEHEGYVSDPTSYTEDMYRESANLTRYICLKYGIPIDREHIIGHNEVPDPYNPGQYGGAGHHTDPGKYWDWDHYMKLVKGDTEAPPPPKIITDNFTIEKDKIELQWEEVYDDSGIKKYDVEISRFADFSYGIILEVNETRVVIENLARHVVYYWRVRAEDNKGNIGRWSDVKIFSISKEFDTKYFDMKISNLVRNPSFERTLIDWGIVGSTLITHPSAEGLYSVCINPNGYIYQIGINLTDEAVISFRYIFLHNISDGAYVRIACYNTYGDKIGDAINSTLKPSIEWATFRKIFRPFNGTKYINIGVFNPTSEKIAVDDFLVSSDLYDMQSKNHDILRFVECKNFTLSNDGISLNKNSSLTSVHKYADFMLTSDIVMESENATLIIYYSNFSTEVEMHKKYSTLIFIACGRMCEIQTSSKVIGGICGNAKSHFSIYVKEGKISFKRIKLEKLEYYKINVKKGRNAVPVLLDVVKIFGNWNYIYSWDADNQKWHIEENWKIGNVVMLISEKENDIVIYGKKYQKKMKIVKGWNLLCALSDYKNLEEHKCQVFKYDDFSIVNYMRKGECYWLYSEEEFEW